VVGLCSDAGGNGNGKEAAVIYLETDVLMPLAGTGRVFALQTNNWWSQLKTAGSAIYANRHYLELYRTWHADRLAQGNSKPEEGQEKRCNIIGDVYIHPTAIVHNTATVRLQSYMLHICKIKCKEVIRKSKKGNHLNSLEKYYIFLMCKKQIHITELNIDHNNPIFKIIHQNSCDR
jgi:NDP-sugar pyrophosphorylase family protein